jgi:hypothetical protein
MAQLTSTFRWTATDPTASSIARTEAYDPVTRCLVRVGEPVPAEGDG